MILKWSRKTKVHVKASWDDYIQDPRSPDVSQETFPSIYRVWPNACLVQNCENCLATLL